MFLMLMGNQCGQNLHHNTQSSMKRKQETTEDVVLPRGFAIIKRLWCGREEHGSS